jgi:CBS domain-containing protein
MAEMKARDLIIPLAQCATVSENDTLCDAVTVMEATRMLFQRWDYRPRIVLVHDKLQRIVGTLRHYEILLALEPAYTKLGDIHALSRSDLTPEFVDSLREKYALWKDPLPDLCARASALLVKDLMRIPSEREYIDAGASLQEAMHRMLTGNHPSLLVTDGARFLGLLRMSDVANHVINEIKKCRGSFS